MYNSVQIKYIKMFQIKLFNMKLNTFYREIRLTFYYLYETFNKYANSLIII